MAALTAATPITTRRGEEVLSLYFELPVKANTVIYNGALVVVDAGYIAPARTAIGLKACGRAEQTVDNTGGAAGAKTVRVARGAFAANNSAAGDAIAQADLYSTVYFVDDNTVAKTDGTGTRSAAGRFVGFDDTGRPMVEIY